MKYLNARLDDAKLADKSLFGLNATLAAHNDLIYLQAVWCVEHGLLIWRDKVFLFLQPVRKVYQDLLNLGDALFGYTQVG